MQQFRFLSDIAISDICFEAYGKSLNQLFENSALALEEVMVETKSIEVQETRKLAVNAESLPDLLFRFLEELVFLKDTQQLLVKRAIVHAVNAKQKKLVAQLAGSQIDPVKQHLRTDVKAITYHMFNLEKSDKGWTARVVVDV